MVYNDINDLSLAVKKIDKSFGLILLFKPPSRILERSAFVFLLP